MNTLSQVLSDAVARIGSRRNAGSMHVTDRPNWTPYLGHVPYFAPKHAGSSRKS